MALARGEVCAPARIKTMTRIYPIYHGLVQTAPWGVACERATGSPKSELLMLCRTEAEAAHLANLTGLGHGLKSLRDAKVAERGAKGSVAP